MMQTIENRPRPTETIVGTPTGTTAAPLTPKGGGGAIPGRIRGLDSCVARAESGGGLPGLILFAGLALAGCGDDSSTTAPAPAPAPPPAPAAPDPVGTPAGLKVTASGHDFLEFGWEAVEGATGYEIQLSLKEGDFTSVSTATVTTTMHRFEVAAETTGWARVRAQEGERQSEWSETATGMSAAAPIPPVTLSAPVPEVSGSGPDFIEWSWEPVADAVSYEVRVAATEEELDAASPEFVAETRHRVTAEPEMEMVLRVRAVAGTTESPIVSDWSDAVAGVSDLAPRPFVVGMSPPEAGADGDCAGQALCPDDGTDPAKARARVNPRMLVSASHRARITPLFVEGAAGVTVEAGQALTPLTYAEWNLLQRRAVVEGAVFEFRKIAGGAGQEATPTGDARFITCGPFACSEAAAEPPAAPAMDAAVAAVCEDFEAEFRVIEGAFNNFQWIYNHNNENQWQSNHLGPNMGLEFGWEYRLSHPATVTHEFPGIAAATPTGTMAVPGADLEVTSTWRVLDMAPRSADPDSLVNKFGAPTNWDDNRQTRSLPGPIRNGRNDCLGEGIPGIGVPGYAGLRRSLGSDRTGDADLVEKPPWRCAVLVTDGYYESYPSLPDGSRWNGSFRDHSTGYRLRVDPQVSVSWAGSRVEWGADDPFEGPQCESVYFPLEYDKCERFRDEVEAFRGGGIGADGQYRLEFDFFNRRISRVVVRNNAPAPSGGVSGQSGDEWRPPGSRHASLWLQRLEPGLPRIRFGNRAKLSYFRNYGIDTTRRDYDLYRVYSRAWGQLVLPWWSEQGDFVMGAREGTADTASGCTDGNCWQPIIKHCLHDNSNNTWQECPKFDPAATQDPLYGDLGKIDLLDADGNPGSDGDPENYDGNPDADFCSWDDNGPGQEGKCDAEVDLTLSATFVLILDTNTCATPMEFPLTCTWDADGDGRRGGDTTFPAGPATRFNVSDGTRGNFFIECEPR